MEQPIKNILTFPLSLLKLSGQHPHSKKIVFCITTVGMMAMCLEVLGVIIYQFYLSFGDPVLFLQNVGSFGGYFQLFAKVVIVALKRSDLAVLVEDSKFFWDTRNCSTELKTRFQSIFPTAIRLQRVWLYIATVTIIAVIVQAYFNQQLPVGIWLIEGHDTFYMFHFVVQSVAFFYVGTCQVVATDQIFLSMCMILIGQFMLLNYKLRELNVDYVRTEEDKNRYLKDVILYVRFHTFLLRFIRNLSKTYSPIMLVEYVSLITALCSAMLIFFESDDMGEKGAQALIMACCFVQLSFYCIVGDYISDQAYNISSAIYETNWYSQHIPEVKYIIPFVIQRSQKETVFTAGGLFLINSRTLLAVSKVAWSICIAIRSMKQIRK